jgi:hypothetical protein
MTALDDLREIQGGQTLSSGQVFDAIFAASSVLNDSDREAESALEIATAFLRRAATDRSRQPLVC